MVVARILALAVLALGLSFAAPTTGQAGTIVGCGADGSLCSWEIAIDGQTVMTGVYLVDLKTGDITLPNPVEVSLGGSTAQLNSVSGNADPIINFGVGGSTGAAGSNFVFQFNLPISLSGLIQADSSVSYSLTSTTAAGAQISPFLGAGPNVVIGTETDTTVGGIGSLNKGVDVGDTFFFVGGPQTQNSPVFTNSNQFIGDPQYDLMSVTVAFSLSPNSSTGLSGFVQQLEVPEPGTVLLILVGVAAVATRRLAA